MQEDQKENQHISLELIEGNSEDSRLIHGFLEKNNRFSFTVSWHRTFSSGLEYLKKKNPQIVLADISHSDLAGLQELEEIINFNPEIPVIALSGSKDQFIEEHAIKLGAQDFIPKDILDENILLRSIRFAIDRSNIKNKFQLSLDILLKILKYSLDAIILVGKSGEIKFFNRSAEVIFGRSSDEMIGTEFGYVVSRRISTEIEILNVKTGKLRHGELRTSTFVMDSEEVTLVTIRDITEKVKAARIFKEQEKAAGKKPTNSTALPICAVCKMFRNSNQEWKPIEDYLQMEFKVKCSHGLCPECFEKLNRERVLEMSEPENNQ